MIKKKRKHSSSPWAYDSDHDYYASITPTDSEEDIDDDYEGDIYHCIYESYDCEYWQSQCYGRG
ncbi:hypothetical protein A6A20_02730 [Volucribacter amazonae]|uniref:Uncharacterized protein n=1 Tax=Volucribacter amazonae TaxID=256731 RepID=A0A9X4PMR6_9PAST|nr:hypothetical protein [Volucribacter amazonae]